MLKLLYGANDPDIHYAMGFSFSDPVFLIDTTKRRYIYLDDRELGSFKELNKNKRLEIISISSFAKKALQNKDKTTFANKLAFTLIKSIRPLEKKIIVSDRFPIGIADYLRSKGVSLTLVVDLYPERKTKTKKEVTLIRGILRRMQKAFVHIENILRESKVKGKTIQYRGVSLTSEFLKYEVDLIFLRSGLLRSTKNIISCGKDSAIPHSSGSGGLRPYQPIVVDLFPRDEKTGYFGDMTRTYVKGRPSPKLEKMYTSVLRVQEGSFKIIKAGVSGKTVHEACVQVFKNDGFSTESGEGFIHATGHGLGLDIHEKPSLGSSDNLLEVGNIVTVEPGLYYRDVGGIRIEDVVLVTKNGCKNLTNYPKRFIIP